MLFWVKCDLIDFWTCFVGEGEVHAAVAMNVGRQGDLWLGRQLLQVQLKIEEYFSFNLVLAVEIK